MPRAGAHGAAEHDEKKLEHAAPLARIGGNENLGGFPVRKTGGADRLGHAAKGEMQ